MRKTKRTGIGLRGKKGAQEMTIGRLVMYIFLAIFLVLVLWGIFSGKLTPLIEKITGFFDGVLIALKLTSAPTPAPVVATNPLAWQAQTLIDGHNSLIAVIGMVDNHMTSLVHVDYAREQCANPRTNPIRVWFQYDAGSIRELGTSKTDRADFVWDAQRNKVFAGWIFKDKIDDWYVAEDFKQFVSPKVGDAFEGILSSKSYMLFVGNIASALNGEKIGVQLEDGGFVSKSAKPDGWVYGDVADVILQNRESYVENWVMYQGAQGKCLTSGRGYECSFYNQNGSCSLMSGGKVCLDSSQERVCGQTCLCPENHKAGEGFVLAVGNKCWVYSLTSSGGTFKYMKYCFDSSTNQYITMLKMCTASCTEDEKKIVPIGLIGL